MNKVFPKPAPISNSPFSSSHSFILKNKVSSLTKKTPKSNTTFIDKNATNNVVDPNKNNMLITEKYKEAIAAKNNNK